MGEVGCGGRVEEVGNHTERNALRERDANGGRLGNSDSVGNPVRMVNSAGSGGGGGGGRGVNLPQLYEGGHPLQFPVKNSKADLLPKRLGRRGNCTRGIYLTLLCPPFSSSVSFISLSVALYMVLYMQSKVSGLINQSATKN